MNIAGHWCLRTVGDHRADGVLRSHAITTLPVLVNKGKNEWHTLNTDPILQAAKHHVEMVRVHIGETGFNDDVFPCLLAYYIGWFVSSPPPWCLIGPLFLRTVHWLCRMLGDQNTSYRTLDTTLSP